MTPHPYIAAAVRGLSLASVGLTVVLMLAVIHLGYWQWRQAAGWALTIAIGLQVVDWGVAPKRRGSRE